MGPVSWKKVFQLSWGREAALEMANMQSFYYFSGGVKKKDSFFPLPDGLQQKQLERLVSCWNQSSTCHIICRLSLVGLRSYLGFGLACRHKSLLEMEKRGKRDREDTFLFSINCPIYWQSDEGHQTLCRSMRPKTRCFFFLRQTWAHLEEICIASVAQIQERSQIICAE